MTRIEELILQRTAIDAEIEAEYKREQEAAARGEADAQFNLGIIYYKGQGVPQNFVEAFGAFKLVSEQGKTQSQYYLGIKLSCDSIVTNTLLELNRVRRTNTMMHAKSSD